MFLSLALTLGIGLASPQQPVISEPCEAAREEEYLRALRNQDLKSTEPEWFVHSIECLGKLESIAAVNPLIELLGFRRSFWWDGTGIVKIRLPTDRYPAGAALARIGKPALPSVIRAITASDPASTEYEVLFYVLLTVFHYEREEGLSFIKKAGIAARTEEETEHLLELARRYAAHNKLEEDH